MAYKFLSEVIVISNRRGVQNSSSVYSIDEHWNAQHLVYQITIREW